MSSSLAHFTYATRLAQPGILEFKKINYWETFFLSLFFFQFFVVSSTYLANCERKPQSTMFLTSVLLKKWQMKHTDSSSYSLILLGNTEWRTALLYHNLSKTFLKLNSTFCNFKKILLNFYFVNRLSSRPFGFILLHPCMSACIDSTAWQCWTATLYCYYRRSPHFVIFGTKWLSWNAGIMNSGDCF